MAAIPPVQPSHTPPRKKPNVAVIVAIAVAVFLTSFAASVFMLVPVYDQTVIAIESPKCMSNIRQVSLVGLIYASDNDDRLADPNRWMDAMAPYAKSEAISYCPTVRRVSGPDAYGYAMNNLLKGLTRSSIENQADVPAFYDSNATQKNAQSDPVRDVVSPPRHQSKNHVGYVDGHTRALSGRHPDVPTVFPIISGSHPNSRRTGHDDR